MAANYGRTFLAGASANNLLSQGRSSEFLRSHLESDTFLKILLPKPSTEGW